MFGFDGRQFDVTHCCVRLLHHWVLEYNPSPLPTPSWREDPLSGTVNRVTMNLAMYAVHLQRSLLYRSSCRWLGHRVICLYDCIFRVMGQSPTTTLDAYSTRGGQTTSSHLWTAGVCWRNNIGKSPKLGGDPFTCLLRLVYRLLRSKWLFEDPRVRYVRMTVASAPQKHIRVGLYAEQYWKRYVSQMPTRFSFFVDSFRAPKLFTFLVFGSFLSRRWWKRKLRPSINSYIVSF